MLRWLSPINAWISRFCMIVAVVGLLTIVAVVALQVFGRYVLNDTPTWAESLALVLVLYVTMFGAAVGVRDAGHIGLESILVMLLPERHRIWVEILIHLLVLSFGVFMAWHAGLMAESVMGYKIPTLGLPEGLNHVPLSIAGVLIVLFSIEHILALLAGKEVRPSWH
ncbi:TRAP transporter small permease [Ferrovibrio sp.]|uniref:TRAP transporter small permease n=1 Tax=Ferrovibrio sp. TaxID=1917215 RepID=UPI0025C04C66|nr:TRAP transporter small permease [Ferrovibrio sp.]MBX3455108.1 TRAP transporter small permease [Ferrovibrio sp.]